MKLEEFIGVQVPSYAILSHTWGEGEVTFQDFCQSESGRPERGIRKNRTLLSQGVTDQHRLCMGRRVLHRQD